MQIAAFGFAAVFLFLFSLKREPEALNTGTKLTCAILVSFAAGAALLAVDDMQVARGTSLDERETMEYEMLVYDVRVETPDSEAARDNAGSWYSYMNKTKIRIRCIVHTDDQRIPEAARHVLLTCSTSEPEYEKFYSLIGRLITVRTELEAPGTAGNPRCFDYAVYLRSEGITHIASCVPGDIGSYSDPRGIAASYLTVKRKLVILRERFLSSLGSGASGRTGAQSGDIGLIRGILFGVTGELDETVENSFRDNGLSHILAVSGMHIGILYALYLKIRKKNGQPWVTACFCALLMMYGTVTLWSVSVRRAIFLVLVTVFGKVLNRRSDMLTSLGAAAVVILTARPCALFGASLQMSFLAVLSIAFLQNPISSWLNDAADKFNAPAFIRSAIGPLAVVLSAQAGMIPYTAYTFNRIPLTALLVAFPAATLLSLMMPLGMISIALFAAIGRTFLLGKLLIMTAEVMIRASLLTSADGRFAMDALSPPVWLIVMIYGAAYFLSSEYFFVARERKEYRAVMKCAAIITAAGAISFVSAMTPFDKAQIVMVDVGQGDCLHIKSGSTDILIDGGGRLEYNVGENVLKPYLLKNGCRDVDIALATHLHTDHYLGLEQLSECYRVRNLVTKGKAGDVIELSGGDRIE
ncbi:MAG: ComEC/Rec2 family competence protein, partial [Eubacterium sp.]|nr:ComEC/Rec2 family competence protein [Eubacterium sp.]